MEEEQKHEPLTQDTPEPPVQKQEPAAKEPAAPSKESVMPQGVPPQRKWSPQAMETFQSHKTSAAPVPPQLQPPVPPQVQPPVPPQLQPPVPPQVQPPVPPQVQPPVPPQVQPPVPPQVQRPVPPQIQRPIPPRMPQQPFPGTAPQQAHSWQPQSMPQQNWYQNHTPQYGGWQVPPQVPPAAPQGKKSRTPEQKDKRAAFWLKIVAGLIVVLLCYMIGSDIVAYRRGGSSQTIPEQTEDVAAPVESGNEVVIQQQQKPELDPDAEGVNADGTYTVEGVAAAVRPSIVEIYTYGDAGGNYLSGTGSGIILSEDGYIITNAHVLTGGKSFTVITSDETEYAAEVVGSDTKTDLAVIHVDAEGLSAAIMGDSDQVVLGEAVVAIGNPAGLSGSVTNGIVSGLDRKIRSDATGFDMNCIQTNAAISPGNSGGALVNMYGQVIGITSSKYVSSSYEGLGFAITINEVLPIVEDLISNGYVSDRVRIGITFVSLTLENVQTAFAEELELDDVPRDLTGIWVTEIAEDCDIANTALQVNDVIVEVEGMDVSDYDTLCEAIDGMKADEEVEAVCRRYDKNGDSREFTITFQLMKDTSGEY